MRYKAYFYVRANISGNNLIEGKRYTVTEIEKKDKGTVYYFLKEKGKKAYPSKFFKEEKRQIIAVPDGKIPSIGGKIRNFFCKKHKENEWKEVKCSSTIVDIVVRGEKEFFILTEDELYLLKL